MTGPSPKTMTGDHGRIGLTLLISDVSVVCHLIIVLAVQTSRSTIQRTV